MLEAELTAHLGYEPHAAEGRNSGNSRNGKRSRKLRTSTGDTSVQVPRDRNSSFQSRLVAPYQTSTNELEDKIIGLYAKGVSTRDIQATLHKLYGVDVSAATINSVTDKVWGLVEASMNRPSSAIYPMVYLDAIHLKVRREGKVVNTTVYVVLGVDLEGQRDVLGHWVGYGAEGANFWLSVVTDLQTRCVEGIVIACIDGLTGFKDAIQAVFPRTHIQRCIIHLRSSGADRNYRIPVTSFKNEGNRLLQPDRFTQADLGAKINVSGSYISGVESAQTSPHIAELEALATVFRTTAFDLIGEAAKQDNYTVSESNRERDAFLSLYDSLTPSTSGGRAAFCCSCVSSRTAR